VAVFVGVGVAVLAGTGVFVAVGIAVSVLVAVGVGVSVGSGVGVGVSVGSGVGVGVSVGSGVGVGVLVLVDVDVGVDVDSVMAVGVYVGVAGGETTSAITDSVPSPELLTYTRPVTALLATPTGALPTGVTETIEALVPSSVTSDFAPASATYT
jgi:hypothetical protein